MKKQKLFALSALLMAIFCTKPALAVDYTINFSATGASSSVGSVIVQNLTKGTSVTVPTGNALRLSDINNAVKDLTSDDASFLIHPQSVGGNYVIHFSAPATGYANISVYGIDGRKITCFSGNIAAGENSFGLTLPQGVFVVNANGNGYSFSKKVNNPAFSLVKADIKQCQGTSPSMMTRQKENAVTGTTFLQYAAGDLILYKGISGNYSTIVTDIPTASKTVTFNFVECKDANGNYYTTVKIGTQTWMAQNLKTTKYRNGDNIQNITNNTDWGLTSLGSWCNYNNSSTIDETYGKIYNWFAASDSRNIAPLGWHVPTDAEWNSLVTTLGDASTSGAKLKETGTSHWTSSYTGTTNESGFSAVAGGTRFSSGDFLNMGTNASWWCANDNGSGYGWYMFMTNSSNGVTKNYYNKNTGFALRCVKDADLPSLTTSDASSVTFTSAMAGGSITSDGGGVIIAKGVCWNTSHNPTISNSKTVDGVGNSTFTSSLTGLTMNTTYYVRAYATTTAGTAYGQEITITSKNYDPLLVTDIDGNLYHTVTIGTQTWIVENLRTTRFRNGDPVTSCWVYNDQESNAATYGRLYTWYMVNDSRNIAPDGWHVASDAEWTTLQNYLIANGYNYDKTTVDNKIAKALCSTTLWNTTSTVGTPGCNQNLNNASGFSMVPGGYRGTDGYYYILGEGTDIWTSTESSSTNGQAKGCGSVISLGTNSLNKNYGFSIRCIKNTTPTVSTNNISSSFSTSVNGGGKVTSDGGESVTEYGICWSTSQQPTIANSKNSVGDGIGAFSCSITGLTPGATYYIRAYATNKIGTGYGEQISFTTPTSDQNLLMDIDGNIYHSITIGSQTWMVENLRTTRYNDGTKIPLVTVQSTWGSLSTPAYCWYNNDSIQFRKTSYGALYNWYSVNTGKLAPTGWHIPTDAEWTTLTTFLNNDGGKLKSIGTNYWTSPNTGATNESGFSAIPAGDRGQNNGTFEMFGNGAFWWSSSAQDATYAYFRSIGYNSAGVGRSGSRFVNGLAVRCIKNTTPTISSYVVSTINTTSATCGGNVTDNGGESVTEYGVCWSTSQSPTIANSKKAVGTGTGAFSTSITGLTKSTTYYVRAYATNSLGTSYGEQKTFTTLESDPITVTDIDGNLYHTVTIGTQTWMVENLRTTRFRNGETVTSCWAYNNQESNAPTYGRLYTWYMVNDARNIAPEGWHVASDAEWTTLQNYLIANGYNYDKTTTGNKIAKALSSASLWSTSSTTGTAGCDLSLNNSSGFSIVPAGYRGYDGYFYNMGTGTDIWTKSESSSTLAIAKGFAYSASFLDTFSSNKNYGFSVRCIKD